MTTYYGGEINIKTSEFNPKRAIVLNELTVREKESYYSLLISNGSKFHRDDEGRYLARIRLLAPSVKIPRELGQKLAFEERSKRLQDQNFIQVNFKGDEEFDYNTFCRFVVLIADEGDDIQPKVRTLQWVMKYIEDMYDSKYSHEMREIEREDDSSVSTNVNNVASIFPYFVVKNVNNIVGLRTLTDQHCWDLLYSVHHYRKDYLEVEMFARFLQEFYYPEDLLFFIYVRNTIAKSFHLSFKGRWAKAEAGPGRQPLPLWMSYKECLYITKFLYDDENKIRDFMKILITHMVGQKSDVSDTRRLDISMFLHFAVVDYHQTHEGQHDGPGGAFFVPPLTAPQHTPTQKQQTSKTAVPNNVNLFDIASSDDHMVDNHLDSYLAALHQERRQNREERGSLGSIGSGYTLDQINLQSIAYHQQQYDEEDNDYNQLQEKGDQIVEEETEIGEEEKEHEVDNQYTYHHDSNNNVDINYDMNEIHHNHGEELENITEEVEGGEEEGGEEEEEEADEFTFAQLEIEEELLAKLLVETPDDVIDYIAPEIQNQLRLRIHTEIENIEIVDLDHFKEVLAIIAEDADVYNELESYRDELLNHILNGD